MFMLAASDVSIALKAGLSVEGVTMYLFWLGTVAMGAGSLYFWLMAGSVPKAYRSVMVVAGIITAVACFHYFRMGGIYLEQVASLFDKTTGQRISGAVIGQFPTAYRYIDWIITVPLLVLEVPLLLNLGKRAQVSSGPLLAHRSLCSSRPGSPKSHQSAAARGGASTS